MSEPGGRFDDVWSRVQAVVFDDPDAAFTFSDRLVRDNGWFHDYALGVIEEYRKFACLAVVCEFEVTPSDEVDQAWHQHLTYSRHYWGEWVAALGKPLHHGPTKGGQSEDDRYWKNYENTLAAYAHYFQSPPPREFWPVAAERFNVRNRFVRLDTSTHIILKRPQFLMRGGNQN